VARVKTLVKVHKNRRHYIRIHLSDMVLSHFISQTILINYSSLLSPHFPSVFLRQLPCKNSAYIFPNKSASCLFHYSRPETHIYPWTLQTHATRFSWKVNNSSPDQGILSHLLNPGIHCSIDNRRVSSSPCVTLRDILPAQTSSYRSTLCRLSATAYSLDSQRNI
jgi:hypothetical protein